MDGSVKQAQAALEASIKASRTDQRAWVGVIGVIEPEFRDGNSVRFLKEDEVAAFSVIIMNSGKTPATQVKLAGFYRLLPNGVKFAPVYVERPDAAHTVIVLQPGMKFILPVAITEKGTDRIKTITKTDMEILSSETKVLYLYGKIEYQDVSGGKRETTYCMYLNKSLDAFNGCNTYNNAN